ncbi:alginate O-acetyltransferase [Deinococcus ruber]|uniref:Probable alginate O-acetylase AlgJ n=1 Tax=Deinococcus ruber TaxID=1848197 RepID=A0A918C150_9DEIO|nr:alginate O-acetyltransferase [Deinococcus ruber]GGR00420.1 alginate O-acetyltransferase [Deinococcus ruber]
MTEFAQDTLKPNIENSAAPRLLQWVPGLFLLAVVVGGGLLAVSSKAATTFPTDQDVVTGKWAHAYETALDADVPFRDPSVNLWATVNYRLFHEAREGALVGADGWLYTNEEFQTANRDAAEVQNKLAYIQEVRDTLAKSGAQLVIALIPAKVRVYPDHLGSLHVPAVNANLYQRFRHQVEALGVPAPDLETAFQTARASVQMFQKTDTHWTPQGAAIAAQLLAQQVKTLKLDLPSAEFKTTLSAPVARKGDLLRYLPVPDSVGPPPDQIGTSTTTRTDSGGGSLLGTDSIPITLVGTSYSARTKNNVWNFDGQLEQALGSEVLNVAEEGKGPIVPMREYLKSQNLTQNPPQVVIWEIPERFLRVMYSNPKKQ